MKPTLALSTCWNSFRHTDGYDMLCEIADHGFTHAELSHGIRIVLVPGIIKAVKEGVVRISSTHNFCPLPPGVSQAAPNLYEPSARDHREQAQWLRYTKHSLDFAAQVDARAMVMHLGSVRFFWYAPSRALRKYAEKHPDAVLRDDADHRKLLDKAVVKMRKRMTPFWTQTLASLEEVRAYALSKSVAIGCENREKLEELPLDDDFDALFAALGQPNTCGYWHDTGHAALKAAMGRLDHRAHLEKNAERLIGFHLHDVTNGGRDHQPIGSGAVDFGMISEFWRPHHLLTLELSPRVSPDDIRVSKDRIDALIAHRFGG